MIQFPDRHFYDLEDFDDSDDSDTIQTNETLNIHEILAQDDPPKDLYLGQEDQSQEIADDVDEDTAWMLYYGDEIDQWNEYCDEATASFNIYDHFGIPSDLNTSEAEAALEAAIPDRT
jgi:hypothetical protein